MLKRSFIIVTLFFVLAATGFAQNSNTSTTRRRTTTATKTTNSSTATDEQSATPQSNTTPARKTTQGKRTGGSNEPTVQDVDKTFDALIAGITRADVEAVTGTYWNSPQLVLYNNNGSVTKGWQIGRASCRER